LPAEDVFPGVIMSLALSAGQDSIGQDRLQNSWMKTLAFDLFWNHLQDITSDLLLLESLLLEDGQDISV
jgi:hypothetical protein